MRPSTDQPDVSASDETGFRHVGDRVVYEGAIWNVVDAEFEAPDGTPFRRDIIRWRGAVGVIPLVEMPDGSPGTVLVRQYRPPFDELVLEIPAGIRDVDGEDDAETARRELIEEVGLDAGRVEVLTSFKTAAGMTDAVTTVCVASECTPVERAAHGPEEEHMELVPIALADAVAMVHSGEISDSKTVIALLMLAASGRAR